VCAARNADDRDRRSPPSGYLVDRVRGAHAPVAADHQQEPDAEPLQPIDDDDRVLRTAGRTEDRAAVVVDPLDRPDGERQRSVPLVRIQPGEPVAEAEDLANPIVIEQLQRRRSNRVVHPGAEAAAGHDARLEALRLEVQELARPGPLEGARRRTVPSRFRQRLHQDALVVTDEVVDPIPFDGRQLQRRSDRRLAQRRDGEIDLVRFVTRQHALSLPRIQQDR